MSAVGGVLWKLRRCLIDYEILSMSRVFAYIPPDDAIEIDCSSSDSDRRDDKVLRSALFTLEDEECHDVTFESYPTSSSLAVASSSSSSSSSNETKSMILDEISLTNLEILVNNFDRTEKGSLWSFLNRCRTAMGRRLLRNWLCHPLYRVSDIIRRQDAVGELLTLPLSESIEQIRVVMKTLPDLERLLSRVHSNGLKNKGGYIIDHPDNRAVMYENYNIRKIKDFADILTGFEQVSRIIKTFVSIDIKSPLLRLALKSSIKSASASSSSSSGGGKFPLDEITQLLLHFRSIFDEKQAKKDGNIKPCPGVNVDYDRAKDDISRCEKELDEYLHTMKKKIGVSDLKYFGSNKDRYQIEVAMNQCSKVPSDWMSKSQKKTHRRYRTVFIENKFNELVHNEERLLIAQKDTLRSIFEKFDISRHIWSDAVTCLALLDALSALSIVSSFPGYCRPEIQSLSADDDYEPKLHITAGRHPMLEYSMLQR